MKYSVYTKEQVDQKYPHAKVITKIKRGYIEYKVEPSDKYVIASTSGYEYQIPVRKVNDALGYGIFLVSNTPVRYTYLLELKEFMSWF